MEVPKGKNLRRIGWSNGWLTVQFRGGRTYRYGPGVDRSVPEKLLRSPYPDHLFAQIVKGKYSCEKLDASA